MPSNGGLLPCIKKWDNYQPTRGQQRNFEKISHIRMAGSSTIQ